MNIVKEIYVDAIVEKVAKACIWANNGIREDVTAEMNRALKRELSPRSAAPSFPSSWKTTSLP